MTSTQQFLPWLFVPVIVWRVYARIRRNIGRQPLRRRRLATTIIVFSVLTGLIGAVLIHGLPALAGLGGGLLLGALLALVSLRVTRFESSASGEFYTPHTAIGLGVTLLLLGRIAYRLTAVYNVIHAGQMPPRTPPDLLQSALTMLMFGATAGYYIAYYAGLLRRSGKKSPPGVSG